MINDPAMEYGSDQYLLNKWKKITQSVAAASSLTESQLLLVVKVLESDERSRKSPLEILAEDV